MFYWCSWRIFAAVMTIIPLSEGAFTIDKSKVFVAFDKQADDLQQRATGSLLVEVQPFVVITSEDVILLDTGLGFQQDGDLQLHANLKRAGVDPGSVTKVLMSHLHKDHAGGISRRDPATGRRTLSLPNASYYIQRSEFEFAMQKGFPSYIPEELECIGLSPRVRWLEGDGVIDGYIKYEVTGAHCPFHQVFWIVDGGETAFFGADVAPQLQQMKSRFVAKYDVDGRLAMELRGKWWQQGHDLKWTFLFYHDINTPVFNP